MVCADALDRSNQDAHHCCKRCAGTVRCERSGRSPARPVRPGCEIIGLQGPNERDMVNTMSRLRYVAIHSPSELSLNSSDTWVVSVQIIREADCGTAFQTKRQQPLDADALRESSVRTTSPFHINSRQASQRMRQPPVHRHEGRIHDRRQHRPPPRAGSAQAVPAAAGAPRAGERPVRPQPGHGEARRAIKAVGAWQGDGRR